MLEPITRETVVDEDLLIKAEQLINNFPKVTGNFRYDIEIYRENDKVLKDLLYQRNLPCGLDGIDINKYIDRGTFLIVKLDPRVEKALERLIQLQHAYLSKI